LAARDSSPGGCRKPGFQCRDQTKDLWRSDISPKVLGPASGLKCSAWAIALGKPGDCNVARQSPCGETQNESQVVRDGLPTVFQYREFAAPPVRTRSLNRRLTMSPICPSRSLRLSPLMSVSWGRAAARRRPAAAGSRGYHSTNHMEVLPRRRERVVVRVNWIEKAQGGKERWEATPCCLSMAQVCSRITFFDLDRTAVTASSSCSSLTGLASTSACWNSAGRPLRP
jgi:hypothetical protein